MDPILQSTSRDYYEGLGANVNYNKKDFGHVWPVDLDDDVYPENDC